AAAIERNEKLALLVKDPSAPPPKGLAGLERFLKITGDDKAARELYAELMGIHHLTLEAAEKDPRKAAEYFQQFCNETYNKWEMTIRTGRYSTDNLLSGKADIAYFLFVSADTRLRQNDLGMGRSGIFFNGNSIPNAIGDKGSPAMRKLFLDWLENEPQTYLQSQGFSLAARAGVKEALPVALRLLDKKSQDRYGLAQVLLSLTKLGTKEHIKVVEKFLDDKTEVGRINFGNGGPHTIQMRDVALGTAIQLAGQKTSDYGFDSRFGGGGNQLYYYYYGFVDDKSREDAHAKWKKWAAENLNKDPAAKTPDAKTPPKASEKDPPKPPEKK
ncbi:MAG TPA: hypothetical protein VKE40_16400, partial [Gemmataceae bacterium]|nr:hypothetical protein [Gemmataceae bacterium]